MQQRLALLNGDGMYLGNGGIGNGKFGPEAWSAGDALPSYKRHECKTAVSIAGMVECNEGIVGPIVNLDIGSKFDGKTVA